MEKMINTINKLSNNVANESMSLTDVTTRINAYIDWIRLEEYADEESITMLRNNMVGAVTHLSNTKNILNNNFLKKDIPMMGDVMTAFMK
ncbi:hypothetical protein UT300009_29780 [Paraclostridium bifermentans]